MAMPEPSGRGNQVQNDFIMLSVFTGAPEVYMCKLTMYLHVCNNHHISQTKHKKKFLWIDCGEKQCTIDGKGSLKEQNNLLHT